MSRGSFSRTVARAAASGGSRAYRSRSPRAWYALIGCICILGIGLIVYSRNEALHPYHAPAVQPTSSARWFAALGIDLCGKLQPNLPENSNFTTVGIRTAGDGVILIDPGAVTNSSSYTGKHDTLGTFASSYPGMALTPTSIQLPGMKVALKNGDTCTSKTGPAAGKAELVAEVWSSPTAKGHLHSGDPTAIKLDNKSMVMLAFVPSGTKLPVPPSKAALLADINGTALKPTPTIPTTSTIAPTSTTVAGASTTVAGSSSTTVAGSAAGSSTTVAGKAAGSSTTVAGSAAGPSTTVAGSAAGPSTTVAGKAAGSSTTVAGAASGTKHATTSSTAGSARAAAR